MTNWDRLPQQHTTDLGQVRRNRRGAIAVTVVLHPDRPPELQAPRGTKFSDLMDAYEALRSVESLRYRRRIVSTSLSAAILEVIDLDWNKRHIRTWLAAHKQDTYESQHPWLCSLDGCNRRFTTEAGAKVHERSCRHKDSLRLVQGGS